MNRLKRILQRRSALLVVLCAQFFLPVFAQSQTSDSLTAIAQGHGVITSAVEERKVTAVLVVLRENGKVLIALFSDLQLQAEGTWTASASAPEEILLKITGGAVTGDVTGSGKLLLTSDRKSFKQLTINAKSSEGIEITVTFVTDASGHPNEGI